MNILRPAVQANRTAPASGADQPKSRCLANGDSGKRGRAITRAEGCSVSTTAENLFTGGPRMKPKATCTTCRFWRPAFTARSEFGECRRYAPRPDSVHDPKYTKGIRLNVAMGWPTTQEGEWCGEHQPKPNILRKKP